MRYIAFFLFIVLSLGSNAQFIKKDKTFYQSKVNSYNKMKKTGGTLLVAGAGLTLVGVVLTSTVDWTKTTDIYGNTKFNSNDSKGGFGIASLLIGIPLTVTGIIFKTIGNKKQKFYSDKMNDFSLKFMQYGKQNNLTLSLKF